MRDKCGRKLPNYVIQKTSLFSLSQTICLIFIYKKQKMEKENSNTFTEYNYIHMYTCNDFFLKLYHIFFCLFLEKCYPKKNQCPIVLCLVFSSYTVKRYTKVHT